MPERCRRTALCALVFVGFVVLGVVVLPKQAGLDSLPFPLNAGMADLTAAGRSWARAAAGGDPSPAATTTTSTTTATTSTSAPPLPTDVSRPLSCLRLTTPSLELSYPADAEAHFLEVAAALSKWMDFAEKQFLKDMKNKWHCGEGFCGPWIENLWIARCNKTWTERAPGTRLADLFGPYIPILVPFVDLWVANVFEYEAMMAALKGVVRPSVPYVALAQHDTGLVSSREKLWTLMAELPNLLVLSAGGYGHVPIPLIKQPEPPSKFVRPMSERKYIVSYMGSRRNAPHNMREEMIKSVTATASKLGIKDQVHVGYGNNWREVMGNSRVSLCPRGYGRTAFHLVETWQMGLVPVHVYYDIPWVPYADLFGSIGFSTDVKGLPDLLSRLRNLSDSALEQMEARVHQLRESHFVTDGVFEQVFRFLTGGGGGGDLRCQKLPSSING